MRTSTKKGLLIFIDALLLLALLGIAPFAWILRDGLGPDSVQGSGLQALGKGFLAFHVGPVILSLCGLHLLLRHSIRERPQKGSRRISTLPVLGTLFLFAAFIGIFISLVFE